MFVGVAVVDESEIPWSTENGVGVLTNMYGSNASASVLTQEGPVMVIAGAPVLAGDPAYVTNAGVLTNVAAGNGKRIGTFQWSGMQGESVPLTLD